MEQRVAMQPKIPSTPQSTIGPYNHGMWWDEVEYNIDRVIEEASKVTNINKTSKGNKSMREVHDLHSKAYKSLANTM